MSYQVIARKWRPQTFEEVTGQEVITQTLRNAIEHDRLHHAYLFSGARGVGKTTTARILAKALNCHKSETATVTPCKWDAPDICPSCQEIAESRSIDVLEIDAASHTGIDDVRETILNSIDFNPARDRYKVFIIDEVHQLSKPAFNALLKTLEEPPDNVVFVMATTELHKVPDTILSRCQEFQFRTIPLQKIFDRLKLIADAEKIDIDDDALRELARSGEGSMRDAQSNFDQVISFSSDKITAAAVNGALGFAGTEILSKTINAITERDPKAALAVVDDLIARGHDLRNFCRDVLGLFRDLLVFKVASGSTELFDSAVFNGEQMRGMSEGFSEADLLRFFNSLAETEASLREAAHPRYALEMGLVKLIEMRKVATIESILERLNAFTSGSSSGSSSKIATAPTPVSSTAPATATAAEPLPPVAATATATESSAEKKTLISEPEPDPEPEFNDSELLDEPPDYISDLPEPVSEPLPPTNGVVSATEMIRELSQNAATSFPVRLPPLSADMLEHTDDTRLDAGYEEKLTWSGDRLMPINGASELVERYFGNGQFSPSATAAPNGGAATAPARIVDVASIAPRFEPIEDVELPVLSDDPSDAELMAYAEAHSAVRAATRVFRAKIVEVKKA
ncbi:MAG: DNA polymerase III subunit gamma/tau [Pyrinomonadaceae bacterium]|nr:DNA polymerase III subunit gamma/tau [Pyrinomonadaceae bacterium]